MSETLRADTAARPLRTKEAAAWLTISQSKLVRRRESLEGPLLAVRGAVARHTAASQSGEGVAAPMASTPAAGSPRRPGR